MRYFAALLCVSLLATACGSDSRGLPSREPFVTAPSHNPQPPAPPEAPRQITLGEEVPGTLTFHGAENVFEVTAPSDGTLIARLSWESSKGNLELDLADKQFIHAQPVGVIVGQLPVTAGSKYRVTVADGAPWDYDDLFLPYVLTTSIR